MNNKERPKLSFCIPTYNRADMVIECVKSILVYKGDDIEIVVSDNCSKDDTLIKLKDIKDERLIIFTNKSNIGYTQNLLKVLNHAKGKYCFMISDEDMVIEGSIPKILSLVQDNSYGLILSSVKKGNIHDQKLKYQSFEQIIKKIIRPIYHYVKYGKNLTSYYVYHERNIINKIESIKKIYLFTYLTGIIIEKDLIPLKTISSNDHMNVYPQILIMLLVNNRSSTYFSKEAFTIMNDIPLKSYIMDEKESNGYSYPHPLARMQQMISSFRWLEELDLSEKEKSEIILFMFETFLNRSRYGFVNYTKQKEKKVSDDDFLKLSKHVHKTIEKELINVSTSDECEEYIVKIVRAFMNSTILN